MSELMLIATCILGFAAAPLYAETKNIPPQIPLKDFFRNPEKVNFQISPDGKNIAFLAPFQNRLNVFTAPTSAPERAERITEVTDRDISAYFWKGSGQIIFSRDDGGDENTHLFSVDTGTKKVRALTPFPGVRANIQSELSGVSSSDILVSMNLRDRTAFDVYRFNVETGAHEIVAENPGNIVSWLADHDGIVRVGVVSDGLKNKLVYRASAADPLTEIASEDFTTDMTPLFFTFDNKNLYMSSNKGRDKSALVIFDLEKGQEIEVIYEHPEVDVNQLYYSEKRKTLIAAAFTRAKMERHFFDPQMANNFTRVAGILNTVDFKFMSWDRSEENFVLIATNDRSRGTYYHYNAKTFSLTKLADAAPWLDANLMAQTKPITYQSRDGLTIHGYLTLPRDYTGGPLPVVVNPHGGPWARDVWGFNPEAQFLASRGYAVFQMNFRGSIGYGKSFWMASFKEWGRKMQDDITDGVHWLISEKIADPERIAIYGGSYGGYATLAGLTFTPELYACGIDYVGVSNLLTFIKSIPPYWKTMLDQLLAMVGNPETETELLKAASPVFHVDKIRAPLLVAQGAKDPRVNIDESNQIVNALKARGIDVPYIVKDNEGHGFRNEENRLEFYSAMEAFLQAHIGKPKNTTVTAPVMAFVELGATPAGKYVEIADDLLCSDNNADTCRSPVDKAKLKQRLVTYEHWAMGYLSAHLNNAPENPAAILAKLKPEVRTKLMQEFILRLKITSRLKPKQLFGEAVLEIGKWLEKELIKKDCIDLLT